MPKHPHRRFITLPEAADYLGVHTKTLRRMIAAGDIPAYRLAGRRRTIRLDLNELDDAMRPIPSVGRSA